jgi:hypothetical protein
MQSRLLQPQSTVLQETTHVSLTNATASNHGVPPQGAASSAWFHQSHLPLHHQLIVSAYRRTARHDASMLIEEPTRPSMSWCLHRVHLLAPTISRPGDFACSPITSLCAARLDMVVHCLGAGSRSSAAKVLSIGHTSIIGRLVKWFVPMVLGRDRAVTKLWALH